MPSRHRVFCPPQEGLRGVSTPSRGAPPGSKALPQWERPRPNGKGPTRPWESLIRAGLLWEQSFLWDFSFHQQQHRKHESQAHWSPGK